MIWGEGGFGWLVGWLGGGEFCYGGGGMSVVHNNYLDLKLLLTDIL